MGFEVRKDAHGTLDIYRRGQPVGRIRGRTIGLHGFWSEGEAERALAAVREGVGRWLWLQRELEANRRLAVTPLWPEPGVLGFEIALPPETEHDQVLRAARVAYYAAFGGGTHFRQPLENTARAA